MQVTVIWPKTILGWAAHLVLIAVLASAVLWLRLPFQPHSVLGWVALLTFFVPWILFAEWLRSISYKFDSWHPLARIAFAVVAGAVLVIVVGFSAAHVMNLAMYK